MPVCACCDVTVDGVWWRLSQIGPVDPRGVFDALGAPEATRRPRFNIGEIRGTTLRIDPNNVKISKAAFAGALHYLRAHRHDEAHPCIIGPDQGPQGHEGLAPSSRALNGGISCISFVLPILAVVGIVGLSGPQPASAWVLRCSSVPAPCDP